MWISLQAFPLKMNFSSKIYQFAYLVYNAALNEKVLCLLLLLNIIQVGTDELEERITGFEDYVQSMDIAAFNKI